MESIETVPPIGRRVIIERPRLTRLLDETNARIILLVAPAGYGKTTLARQWVAAPSRRHGWYPATYAAADVAALAAGVAKAAGEIVPDAGARMIERLRAAGAPPPTPIELADLLKEDLQRWPDDAWLVVDDYHFAMESDASETFMEAMSNASIQLAVLSRNRPRWATARRNLYGEVVELGREALALSPEEARQILAGRDEGVVSTLIGASRGWPAVIGLASIASVVPSTSTFSTGLHAYFAEELFGRLPPRVQGGLTRLAVCRTIREGLSTSILGRDARLVVEASEEAGFLVATPGGEYEVHPLLRDFLLRRLAEAPDAMQASISAAGENLLSDRRWDEAFILVSELGATALIEPLLRQATPDLLSKGRSSTLANWAAVARAQAPSPLVILTEALLAFRRADYVSAQALAELAATDPDVAPTDLAEALLVAGNSAFFSTELDAAERFFAGAVEAASTPEARLASHWGMFALSVEREDIPSARTYLAAIEVEGRGDAETTLRLVQSRLAMSHRSVREPSATEVALAALPLIHRVESPTARSGFLNSLCYSLNLESRYGEALDIAGRLVTEIEQHGLVFARPHALLSRARAEIGLRQFTRAAHTLEFVRSALSGRGDPHVEANLRATRARIELATQQHDSAVESVSEDLTRTPDASTHVEYYLIRALAQACTGAIADARRTLTGITRHSASPEPVVLRSCIDLTIDVASNQSISQESVEALLELAYRTRCYDPLVLASRAYPATLVKIIDHCRDDYTLKSVFELSNDRRLAHAAGLALRIESEAQWGLTPREREVLELLCRGMKNREIARQLFVTEVTIKVHLRHIYEKLGVRSRTEAAILFHERGSA